MKGRTLLRILCVLLIMYRTISLYGLDPDKPIHFYVHDIWNSEDGLPQNSVTVILQTRDGYIWLGTQEGLVRFNGKGLEVFDTDNTPELPGNYIKALLEDQEGALWIGTNGGGVGRWKDGKFTRFDTGSGLTFSQVSCLYEYPAGTIWVGTHGGGVNIIKNNTVSPLRLGTADKSDDIRAICRDKDDNMWIGTNGGGLIKINNNSGNIDIFNEKHGLPDNKIRSVFESVEGDIWVGSATGGVCLYDRANNNFKVFGVDKGFPGGNVAAIFEDRHGNLWFGTRGEGLVRYARDKFSYFNMGKGLSNDIVWCIYEDREGNLWIGTDGGGLDRLKDGKVSVFDTELGLSNDIVFPILESHSGDIYIGTEGGGLNRLKDGKVTVYNTENNLPNNMVFSLYEDKKGFLWIGTYGGGLSRLDPETGFIKTFTEKDGLSSSYLWCIAGSKDGYLWLGTESDGVSRFHNGTFTNFTRENGLSSDQILIILVDSRENVWIGTNGGGLNRINGEEITVYDIDDGLSDNIIYALHEDETGTLWIGTSKGGVNRFKEGTFTACKKENGLFDNLVFQIVEDNKHGFWITCNRGLFQVSRKELNDFCDGKRPSVNSIIYGKDDGMKSAECNGNCQPAGYKTSDGKLWFPTLRGAVIIDPENIKNNTLPPPVIIEKVLVGGHELDIHHDARLKPGSKNIEFHYAALSFTAPEKIKFRYKLEGFDKRWIDAGDRRKAFYTNLSPASYRFRVIACNNDGVWNENGTAFGFVLKPYFTQTLWFYILCSIALTFIGIGIYWFRVRRLKHREEELEHLVSQRTDEIKKANEELKQLLQSVREANEVARKEREIAEAANRSKNHFLARMSHEIRTPMNSVIGFTEMLLDSELGEEQMDFAATISQSGRALVGILDDIMDLSRIEAGELSIEPMDFDPEKMVFEVCELVGHRIGTRDVEILCRIGDRVPYMVKQDPVRFRQVLTNLMGNAAKFTEAGEIVLSLDIEIEEQDRIMLHAQVRDTGIGIPAEKLETIFRPFQQADDSITRKYGGTGLGLSISREIARLMGGDIWAESSVGIGSVFHFIVEVEISAAQPVRRYPGPHLEGKRILIADDNSSSLDILEHLLQRHRIDVMRRTGCEDVVPSLRNAFAAGNPIDICILALRMTGMDGNEIAAQIRKEFSSISKLTLIALSPSTFKQSRDYREAGFDCLLVKPVCERKLLKAIECCLNGYVKGKRERGEKKKENGSQLFNSVNVLLAEDNPINQKLARFMLARAGVRLDVAENGREAVEKYIAHPDRYNLVLMDIQMPEMDGREAARVIRSKGFTTIPIIAMTAESMKGDREKCLAAGMNDYISKPISREDVLNMIKQWV